MIIKPVDLTSLARHFILRNAQETIYLWFRPSTRQSPRRLSALQGKGCVQATAKPERPQPAGSIEKSGEHAEVWEPSQDGVWPSSPAFSLPACNEGCGQNENVHATKVNQAHVAVCSVHFSNNAEMKSDCKECTQLKCSSVFK